MLTSKRKCAGLLACLIAASASAQTVVDGTNSPYLISSPATLAQVQVSSDGVLVLNSKLTVTGDMVVLGGGRVTVDPSVMRLQLAVNGTLTVEFGASIDSDAKGLPGGGASAFGTNGATLDPVTFMVVAGGNFGPGGSHATRGEFAGFGQFASPSVYGTPLMLNPGGGGGGSAGGAGGGVCELAVGALVLNGQIRSNGGNATSGGGGAGGSIGIAAGAVSGGGSLQANGGIGGGAGRIKATFTTWTFGGAISAVGAGSAWGSVYLLDSTNRLLVVTPVELTGGESFAGVVFGSGGSLLLSGDSQIQQPVSVPVDARLTFNHARAADRVSLATVAGTMVVSEPLVLRSKLVLSGTMVLDKALSVPDLDVTATGVVTHSALVRTFNLAVSGTLHVFPGGVLDATGKGLPGGSPGSASFGQYGSTIDPSSSATVAGSAPGNGGSHAGLGGRAMAAAAVASVYDNVEQPVYPGGGGGGWEGDSRTGGGSGGGVIRVSAATLILDGRVSADGAVGPPTINPAGSGAGGTVFISTGALSGAGQVTARGGLGSGSGSGGGGGIVHINASTIAASVTRTAAGGGGPFPGAAGAVVEHLSTGLKIVSLPAQGVKTGTTLSYQAMVVGATGSVSWSLTAAPPGAAVSASGLVTWAATGSSRVAFTLEATDGTSTDSQTFSLDVLTGPTVISTANISATLNTPYQYDADSTAEATGSGPITWSVLAGPSGFTIAPQSGAVSWLPAALGAFSACLKAINPAGEAVQCFAVQVTVGSMPPTDAGSMPPTDAGNVGAPKIRSTPSTTAFCGVPYHYSGTRLPEADGAPPLTYSIEPLVGSALPSELTVDSLTGELTWTPTKANAGTTPLRLVVTNSAGRDEQVFSIAVECPGVTPKAIGCSCAAGGLRELLTVLALTALIRRGRRR